MILPIVRREISGASLSSDLHPVIDRIYRGRNIANIDDLENGLRGLTHFNALKGMPEAALILATAIEQNKRIIIVGDFDADGATSTSVCILALRAMGFDNVDFLVPNRFDFGYGLSVPIVDEAAKQGADIIVTVDNGICCSFIVDILYQVPKPERKSMKLQDQKNPSMDNGRKGRSKIEKS